MKDYHPLVIKDKILETSTCVSLGFEVPDHLKGQFAFKAGQYLGLRAEINGEDVRRSYSICSAEDEDEWRVAVKKVPGGRFSNYAMDQLEVGQTVEVLPPDGHFIQKKKVDGSTYCMVAAGSGITPIISLIKTILKQEPKSQIILIYGNKSLDQVIFKEEIEGLKNQYMNRFRHYYVLSQESQETDLFNGRIDAEKCKAFAKSFFNPNDIQEFFVCGPEAMIWSVKDTMEGLGVAEERIRFELFTTSAPQSGEVFVGQLKEEEKENQSNVTVIIDGQESEFSLGYQGKSILDAALDKGNDLPFACKGGVCCTCKARLLEGEVEMEVNYALEEDELKAGMILTCQSHPRTAKIKVDYDV